MANVEYTEEQRAEFVEMAELEGITPAMRILGFPKHWMTGKKWCDNAGVEVSLDALQQKAAAFNRYYTNAEKMVAAQSLLNRLVEAIERDPSLTADELNKLASGIQKAIQVLALVEGTATDRRETVQRDGTDMELYELLNEAKARNANAEEDMLHRNSE